MIVVQGDNEPAVFINDETLQTISITENKIVLTFCSGNQSTFFEKKKVKHWDKLVVFLHNKSTQHPWVRAVTPDACFAVNGMMIDMFTPDKDGDSYTSFVGGGEIDWNDSDSAISVPLVKSHLNDKLVYYFQNHRPLIIL